MGMWMVVIMVTALVTTMNQTETIRETDLCGLQMGETTPVEPADGITQVCISC